MGLTMWATMDVESAGHVPDWRRVIADEVEILYREVVGRPGGGWLFARSLDVLYIEVSSIDLRFGHFPIDREAISGQNAGHSQTNIGTGHTIALPSDIQSCEVGRRSWHRNIFGPVFGTP